MAPTPPTFRTPMQLARHHLRLTTLSAVILAVVASGSNARPLPRRVSFNEHIRPIFAEQCVACHGGVKGRTSHGETDPIGFSTICEPTHVRDLHAAMLHLLGIDHLEFKYPLSGACSKTNRRP